MPTEIQQHNEPLVSQAPLRFRLRAKRLHQRGALPPLVQRYLKHRFPCMCGLKYRSEVAQV